MPTKRVHKAYFYLGHVIILFSIMIISYHWLLLISFQIYFVQMYIQNYFCTLFLKLKIENTQQKKHLHIVHDL